MDRGDISVGQVVVFPLLARKRLGQPEEGHSSPAFHVFVICKQHWNDLQKTELGNTDLGESLQEVYWLLGRRFFPI